MRKILLILFFVFMAKGYSNDYSALHELIIKYDAVLCSTESNSEENNKKIDQILDDTQDSLKKYSEQFPGNIINYILSLEHEVLSAGEEFILKNILEMADDKIINNYIEKIFSRYSFSYRYRMLLYLPRKNYGSHIDNILRHVDDKQNIMTEGDADGLMLFLKKSNAYDKDTSKIIDKWFKKWSQNPQSHFFSYIVGARIIAGNWPEIKMWLEKAKKQNLSFCARARILASLNFFLKQQHDNFGKNNLIGSSDVDNILNYLKENLDIIKHPKNGCSDCDFFGAQLIFANVLSLAPESQDGKYLFNLFVEQADLGVIINFYSDLEDKPINAIYNSKKNMEVVVKRFYKDMDAGVLDLTFFSVQSFAKIIRNADCFGDLEKKEFENRLSNFILGK